jgi:hypothetical protein
VHIFVEAEKKKEIRLPGTHVIILKKRFSQKIFGEKLAFSLKLPLVFEKNDHNIGRFFAEHWQNRVKLTSKITSTP